MKNEKRDSLPYSVLFDQSIPLHHEFQGEEEARVNEIKIRSLAVRNCLSAAIDHAGLFH